MLASYQHRFIFLRTRKTGGTSLEIALSPLCVGRDICTPIGNLEDEFTRIRHGGSPRNFGPGWLREWQYLRALKTGNTTKATEVYRRLGERMTFYNLILPH